MNRRDFSTFIAALLSCISTPLKAMFHSKGSGAWPKNISFDQIVGSNLIIGETSTILVLGKNLDYIESIRFDHSDVVGQIVEKEVSYLAVNIDCPSNISSDSLSFCFVFNNGSTTVPLVEIKLPILKPIEMTLANYEFSDYQFDDYFNDRSGYDCEWKNIPNGFRLDCYFTSNGMGGNIQFPGIGSELI